MSMPSRVSRTSSAKSASPRVGVDRGRIRAAEPAQVDRDRPPLVAEGIHCREEERRGRHVPVDEDHRKALFVVPALADTDLEAAGVHHGEGDVEIVLGHANSSTAGWGHPGHDPWPSWTLPPRGRCATLRSMTAARVRASSTPPPRPARCAGRRPRRGARPGGAVLRARGRLLHRRTTADPAPRGGAADRPAAARTHRRLGLRRRRWTHPGRRPGGAARSCTRRVGRSTRSWCARRPRTTACRSRSKGPDVAGRRVLAVEDTSTTGGSVLQAVDVLQAAGRRGGRGGDGDRPGDRGRRGGRRPAVCPTATCWTWPTSAWRERRTGGRRTGPRARPSGRRRAVGVGPYPEPWPDDPRLRPGPARRRRPPQRRRPLPVLAAGGDRRRPRHPAAPVPRRDRELRPRHEHRHRGPHRQRVRRGRGAHRRPPAVEPARRHGHRPLPAPAPPRHGRRAAGLRRGRRV